MRWFGKREPQQRQEPRVVDAPSNVPKVGKKRAPRLGRSVGAGRRMFDAGQSDRLTGNWSTTPLTADDVIRRNLRALVARSREQAANNDHGRAFLRMVRQNIIGPRGIQMQAQSKDDDGSLDMEANAAIEAAWAEWSKAENCDVTGRLPLRQLQGLAVQTAARDGEFFVQIVTGRDAGPWGFALNVIDPQRCPVDLDEVKLAGGRFIRHGIEFSQYGRPVAYYFTTTAAEESDYSYGGRSFVRIPADQIIHPFVSDMIGQKRGLPWMATALWRMHQLEQVEKAALVNAREGANKAGFIEWDEGYGADAVDENDEPIEVEIESEAGVYHELPAGARFKEYNPTYPSGEFAVFAKHQLRGISAGLGVAYNNLASDLEGVNYSSIRQGTIDEREHWKDLQEWVVESLMAPIFTRWLKRSLVAGKIKRGGKPLPAEKLGKFSQVAWQPRRWDWIDPNADVKAAVTAKNNLLMSPSQIIRDRGQDPQTVWRDIARDIADMRAAGIPEEIISAVVLQKAEGSNGSANSAGQSAGNQGDGGSGADGS
ncbi:phage portal protein [Sulfitobacter sp. OXR-159]|uniref:phage portal protein n=1 Tax=Sulfitobacter sp. OXR-159 TaxID=3100174 RepID=UPI002AC9E328|nr:phage portal protein [Sulfitobacter sp. OXR-159]WPZ28965.1 phage portal protein [Sulfitobacter sp. OXR-159]